MKSIANSLRRGSFVSIKVILASITCLLFLITPSCEKTLTINSEITSEYLLSDDLAVYMENTKTSRYKGKPGVTTIPIGQQNLSEFEDCFVLYIKSGETSATAVSSAIIKLDDQEVLNTSDFSKHSLLYTFEVCNITEQSVITVEVRGEPGSYIDIWIEGSLKKDIINPTFQQIGPICQNSTPPGLPATSENGINGTWNPSSINTSATGTTIFTFTPDLGQNAKTTTMDIEVLSPVVPLFTPLGPFDQDSETPELPGTSINGITGTWDAFSINTSVLGKTTYTFTPDDDQCASVVEMDIEIKCQLTDADGNCYVTVTIGTQTWMAENLKTTKYNDGTSIPLVTDGTAWGGLTGPGYCWYDNDKTTYGNTYGTLYNWYAVADVRGICPTGWLVPSNTDWETLETYLIANGYNYDGSSTGNKIAKALASEYGWLDSTVEGAVGNTDYPAHRNILGFTALPGGYRVAGGTFYLRGASGYWWSDSEYYENAWHRFMRHAQVAFGISILPRTSGLSVRCLKDSE